mgnify:FL=1
MYFNGKNSALYLKLNENSINLNTSFPTLENGLSFVFWCYVKKDLMTQMYKLDEKNKFKLIEIKIGEHQICLILNDLDNIKIVLDENDSSEININSCMKYNEWNNICFTINTKSALTLDINLVINSKNNNTFLPITKEFEITEKINEIILFKNFLGLVSSVLFFSFELNEKQIEYFNSLKYGFNKKSILYEFFIKNNKDFLSNGVNHHKYSKKIKVDKSLNLFDFSLKKQNIKNLVSFLLPFNYNKERNEIYDIFGNFYGIFSENDGVNNYKNILKNIKTLGGMKQLLPIIELMYSANSRAKNIKYEYIDKNILSTNNFLIYCRILNNLLIKKEKNIIDANFRKYFSSLAIFLEKFPNDAFNNDEIAKIFINIAKASFDIEDSFINNDNFVNMILMNEKILYKFSKENQFLIWDNLYILFLKKNNQLKECLNTTKICMIIRYYDENRYNEYCCTKHANLFKPNEIKENEDYKPKIMKPEMDIMLDKFFGIVSLYIEKISDKEKIVDIYKLLLMDLNPCLQKMIISLFYNYFSKNKIPISDKKKLLEILLKNNMLDISEYVLIISILDVRIEILKLFQLINSDKDLSDIYTKYVTNMKGENGHKDIHKFFGDNSLPDKIIINEGKENNKLINYFNLETYEKDLDSLWNYLTNWLTYKSNPVQTNLSKSVKVEIKPNNIKSNLYISETYLEYCLLFISKAPEKFVDLFISILFSFFKDQTINNRIILYENEHIYPWIIQTIFYFYNKENENQIKNKNILINIKNKSLNFFGEFFSHRRPGEEFMKRAKYILEYSYKLKEILKDDDKKIEETSRITRILLEKLFQKAPKKINEVINLCFEYIIYYKNKEKSEEINKNKNKDFRFLMNEVIKFKVNSNNSNDIGLVNYGLMPKFIYEGLNCNKIDKKVKKYTLKEIWKDATKTNGEKYIASSSSALLRHSRACSPVRNSMPFNDFTLSFEA